MENRSIPRVLAVDDTPANLVALEAMLVSSDYRLVTAISGAAAFEALEAADDVALILLDVQMPSESGFEVARRLRRDVRYRHIPIIFMTAADSHEYLDEGYASGAVDYLSKPFHIPALLSKVNIFVELWAKSRRIEEQNSHLKSSLDRDRDELLEHALDAVVGMSADDEIIYWNIQAEQVFGWSREEVVGRRMSDLIIPPSQRKHHLAGVRRFLANGRGPILNQRVEVTAIRRDGSEFPVELTATAIRAGDSYKFYSFIRDITDRKKAEESLRHAVQARDEFLGICSHELRTPLTSLKLQYQMAAMRMARGDERIYSKDEVKRRVTGTNRQIERMTKVIGDMLDLTTISRGALVIKKEDTDLARLVREVVDQYSDQLAESGVHLEIECPECLVLKCDQFRVEQVLSNLITNALKYGNGNPVHVLVRREKSHAVLVVRDEGRGLAQEDLNRIFQKFERAISPSEVSGLGLGLYISQKIVTEHGGEITAQSEKGKGSVFTVRLPICE